VVDTTRDVLLERIRSARSEVMVAAPYLSQAVAAEISLAALESRSKSRMLLTALNDGAVAGGFLAPAGLRLLIESRFEVRSIRNLHAKFALIDRKWGIVGSGNLTSSGLAGQRRRNLELGVILSAGEVVPARRIAARWWKKGKPVDPATLARYERMAPKSRGGSRRSGGFGPIVEGSDEPPQPIPERRRGGSTGLWLKMMHHYPGRDGPNWWRSVKWVSDGRPPPSPKRLVGGPSYSRDDLMVFYLVEKGGSVRRCPAIAKVVEEARYRPSHVARHGFPGDELKWPWVTKVEVLDSSSLDQAPRLDDLDVSPKSVRQQGRLVLQPEQFEAARQLIAEAN